MVLEKRSGHIHLLMNCVNKHRETYDGIGLLAVNGVVMFLGGFIPYPSHSKLYS